MVSCEHSSGKVLVPVEKPSIAQHCEPMEFAVIGHCVRVIDLLISLLMVCQDRQLECIKSMDSTVSVHLSLRLSLSLVKRTFTASSLASLVSAYSRCILDLHNRHPSMECSLCLHLEVCFSWQQLAASCSMIHRHCSGW